MGRQSELPNPAIPLQLAIIPGIALRQVRYIAVASPAYLARHETPQHPRDLLRHQCVRFRFASGHLYKWQFERGGQALEIDVPGRLTLCEQGTVVRAVLDGIGLAYVLEDTARPYIESGQMVAVLEDWSEPFAGWVLYYPRQRQMSSALRGMSSAAACWKTCRTSPLQSKPRRGSLPPKRYGVPSSDRAWTTTSERAATRASPA
mgnify:CR=1 FL=1